VTCVKLLNSIAFSVVGMAATLVPSAASIHDDARKICLERYVEEKAGNSVPAGMSKERYLRQCQGSYVKTASREQSYDESSPAPISTNGQGGPEILPPGTTILKATPRKLTVPTPRFKPAV